MDAPSDRLTPRGVIVAVGGGAMLVALLVIWSLAFGPESPAPAAAGPAPKPSAIGAPATTPQGSRAAAARTTPTTPAPTSLTAPTTPAVATTPAATPPSAGAAADPLTTPKQARDLATRTLPLVEACAARAGDYARCTSAEQLGAGALPIASDPPVPGAVAITASSTGYYVRAADADGRLWGVQRRAGSLNLRRTCHEADGVTSCAGLHW